MILLDLPNALLIIVGVINIFLVGLILTRFGESVENKLYSFNTIFIVLWTLAMIFYRSFSDGDALYVLTLFLYIAPTFIASSFFYFALFFPRQKVENKLRKAILIFTLNILIVGLVLIPGMVIESAYAVPTGEHVIMFGPFYFVYVLYTVGYFSGGMLILASRLFHTRIRAKKYQIGYLLGGYFVGSSLAMATNLLLPWLGVFAYNWLGQVLTIFIVLPVVYAIFQYRLFDVRMVAAQGFILLLWIFVVGRLVLSQGQQDIIVNGVLLVAVVLIGILLLRSINKEIKAREEIEELAEDLRKANSRLEALDEKKSEFISIASHQLRSPLTAIRGYASILSDGDLGKMPKSVSATVGKIYEISNNMTSIVEDFLNVSRIEQGRMEYNFDTFDVAATVRDIVEQMQSEVEEKGLELSFDGPEECEIKADQNKIQQVIRNLVDNAVKYTPEGSVAVHLTCEKKDIRIAISDTGVGMSQKTRDALFQKFSRANNAHETNISGTGLGLYIGKNMAEAHGGSLEADSGGEGKGSTFTIRLPKVANPSEEDKQNEKNDSKDSGKGQNDRSMEETNNYS